MWIKKMDVKIGRNTKQVPSMNKSERDWLSKSLSFMQAELEIWRKSYPRSAPGMREEAEAQVEGRESRHLPPMMYG